MKYFQYPSACCGPFFKEPTTQSFPMPLGHYRSIWFYCFNLMPKWFIILEPCLLYHLKSTKFFLADMAFWAALAKMKCNQWLVQSDNDILSTINKYLFLILFAVMTLLTIVAPSNLYKWADWTQNSIPSLYMAIRLSPVNISLRWMKLVEKIFIFAAPKPFGSQKVRKQLKPNLQQKSYFF